MRRSPVPSADAEKRKRGRPTVWTDDLEAAFFRTLGTGCSIADAALSCGIGKNVVMRRQRTDAAFRERVEKARCDFKVSSLAIIAKAAPHNWTAAAWYLERVYPHEFGRSRVELSGPNDAPVEIDFSHAEKVGRDPEARVAYYASMAVAVGDRLRPDEAAYLASLLDQHKAQRHAPTSDDPADPAACDSLGHARDDECQ